MWVVFEGFGGALNSRDSLKVMHLLGDKIGYDSMRELYHGKEACL
jgi:hypothetical protein